jgi:hypothetical protein
MSRLIEIASDCASLPTGLLLGVSVVDGDWLSAGLALIASLCLIARTTELHRDFRDKLMQIHRLVQS